MDSSLRMDNRHCVVSASVGHYKKTLKPQVKEFHTYAQQFARQLSHPQIMFKANLQNGQEIIVDDYREAYWWLRDHTPEGVKHDPRTYSSVFL